MAVGTKGKCRPSRSLSIDPTLDSWKNMAVHMLAHRRPSINQLDALGYTDAAQLLGCVTFHTVADTTGNILKP